jgi:hypothetical protein
MRGISVLRGTKKGGEYVSYVLTVPAPLSRTLRDNGAEGTAFRTGLTDEGILFRPVVEFPDLPQAEPPAWLRGEA